MSMIGTRAYLCGLLLIALVACGWYAHHRGAVSQAEKDATRIAAMQVRVDAANAQIRDDADVMRQINESSTHSADEAAAQRGYAAALSDQVAAAAKAHAKDESAWASKFAKAMKDKGCAAQLQAPLCDQVGDY